MLSFSLVYQNKVKYKNNNKRKNKMKMQVNRRRTRIVITQGAKTDLLEQTVLRRSRIPTLKLIFSFRILHQLYIVFHESGVKRNAIFPKFTTMQAKKIFFILSENETKQRAIPSYDPRPFLRRNIVYRILKTASDYAECYISTRIYPSFDKPPAYCPLQIAL